MFDKIYLFIKGYVDVALWSSPCDKVEFLDQKFSIEDIIPTTLIQMRADCLRFLIYNSSDVCWYADIESAGHDFWLTRNYHGAGFWDRRGIGNIGERLTNAAHNFKEFSLYEDDGKIHGM